MLIRLAGLLALALCAFGFVGGGEAQACMAMGQPKIAIKLDGKGNGQALISEYDCRMMVRKTNCIVGIRLSDAALAESRVAVDRLRFVHLNDRSPVQGFEPAKNGETTVAFNKVMDGTWFGFSALYGAEAKEAGGLAIEVSFTYDPATPPQKIAAAFDRGHVGLGEGTNAGGLAHGHMLEVVQIQGARVATDG